MGGVASTSGATLAIYPTPTGGALRPPAATRPAYLRRASASMTSMASSTKCASSNSGIVQYRRTSIRPSGIRGCVMTRQINQLTPRLDAYSAARNAPPARVLPPLDPFRT